MSTFTGTQFNNVVSRMHPNNITRDIVVGLATGSSLYSATGSNFYIPEGIWVQRLDDNR